MKVINKDNNNFVLRFDPGEELFASLGDFLNEQSIKATMLSGIGTCTQVELGYFNIDTKRYERHLVEEELEVLNISGNSATMEGKPVVHLHGSFSRRDLSVIGGHVFSMVVAATTELNLIKLEGDMRREKDEEFGLNLLA